MRRSVTRREFLEITAGSAMASAVGSVPGNRLTQRPRPNILFILADDLGCGDLSCYGRPDYQTPTLDRLAQQGIKFTSAYSAAAVCTPTRCAFVTGRYPQRLEVGLQEPLTRRSPTNVGLPPGHPTVASLVGRNGYDTALIGKWHLGWRPEFGPNRHGYDEFFGILSGAADYFRHQFADGAAVGTRGGEDLWENLTPIERTGYLTDLLTDRAVEYIARKHVRPFYLSLHYTAPHAPWEGPEDAATDHAGHGDGPMTGGGSLRIFASMMTNLDAGIGRALAALGRAGLEENTLVIFTSDNGGERVLVQLAVLVRQGIPLGRRDSRPGDRPVAGRHPGRPHYGTGRHHDGLDRNAARRGRHEARRGASAGRRKSPDRLLPARASRSTGRSSGARRATTRPDRAGGNT